MIPPSIRLLRSTYCAPTKLSSLAIFAIRMTRRFFQRAKISITPGANSGATTTSAYAAGDQLRGFLVHFPVQRDGPAKCGNAVRHVGLAIRLGKRCRPSHAAGVVVLHDDGARGGGQVAQDIERVVRVGDVDLARVLPRLQELDVRGEVAPGADRDSVPEGKVAVHQAVQGSLLPGIFSVAKALFFTVDHPGGFFVVRGSAGPPRPRS